MVAPAPRQIKRWLWLPLFVCLTQAALANGVAIAPDIQLELLEYQNIYMGKESFCIASESGQYRMSSKGGGKGFQLKGSRGAKLDIAVFIHAFDESQDVTRELEVKGELRQMPTALRDGDCRSYRVGGEIIIAVPEGAAEAAIAGYYSGSIKLQVKSD